MIDDYHFGSIAINGKTYNYDVEIKLLSVASYLDQDFACEIKRWQRKESHIIDVSDVLSAIEQKPELIIIGTGEIGVAKVTALAQKKIKDEGIKLLIGKTGDAVKFFNNAAHRLKGQHESSSLAIGLLHLTC